MHVVERLDAPRVDHSLAHRELEVGARLNLFVHLSLV